MKTVNYQRCYEQWETEAPVMNKIIYLDAHRRPVHRRKNSRGDVFWNVVFVGLCLSVLVVLFLH